MRVIPTFDPFEHRCLSFEPTTVEQFALERGEKALRHRVVVRVADRSHRRHHVGFPAALSERVARVLTSAIGMVDHRRRPALRDRHVQSRQNQLRSQVGLHRPTDDAARVHIQHPPLLPAGDHTFKATGGAQ